MPRQQGFHLLLKLLLQSHLTCQGTQRRGCIKPLHTVMSVMRIPNDWGGLCGPPKGLAATEALVSCTWEVATMSKALALQIQLVQHCPLLHGSPGSLSWGLLRKWMRFSFIFSSVHGWRTMGACTPGMW